MRASSPPATLDPDWLAHRYDPGHDAVHFIRTDRAERRRVPFLTDEYLPGHAAPVVAHRNDALARAPAAAPIHYIFHSAYCCSTLLANVLDLPGVAVPVKEPVILNDLVGWRHRGAKPAEVGAVLDASLRLLARPFALGETVVIKPSNVVNGLAPAMLGLRPVARALLLHAPLEVYLGSIAGKGLWGRRWVRDLLLKQLKDGIVDLGFTQEDYLLLSDLQVAAVGWLAQHKLFADLVARYPDRVRTLGSEILLARSEETLAAIGPLFSIALDSAAVANSDAFRRNAKDGSAFGRDQRAAGQRSNAGLHADEIEKILIWAEAVAANAGVTMTLPAPLLGD